MKRTTWVRAVGVSLAALLFTGCSEPDPESESAASTQDAVALSCTRVEELTVRVEQLLELPGRIYLESTGATGTRGVLTFDTGSPLSLLYRAENPADTAPKQISFGCTSMSLWHWPFPAPTETLDSVPKTGILGANYALVRPTELDLPRSRMRQYRDLTAMPDTSAWTAVKIDVVDSQMIATVTIDGVATRLLVDTGAPNILLLEPAHPGDVPFRDVTDINGDTFPSTLGVSQMTFAGEPANETLVEHVPRWPYLSQKLAPLGADIKGLLGLTAFRWRRVMIDGTRMELRLSAEEAPPAPPVGHWTP